MDTPQSSLLALALYCNVIDCLALYETAHEELPSEVQDVFVDVFGFRYEVTPIVEDVFEDSDEEFVALHLLPIVVETV
jgi:hypothetical protein